MLVGLAALGIDMSLAMAERRNAQNAADQSALSASWARCTGGTAADASVAAAAAATRNGFTPAELTLTGIGGNGYETQIMADSPTFFAGAIGFDKVEVSTRAVAECDSSTGSANAIFALGDTCPGFGKLQIDVPGSLQTVYGGVHSNANV